MLALEGIDTQRSECERKGVAFTRRNDEIAGKVLPSDTQYGEFRERECLQRNAGGGVPS
jgi:hypothetical protein